MILKWITPFVRQCYVSFGVSLNMANLGLVMGFSTILLPQLRSPISTIYIDDSIGSWIAALPGITIILGNFIVPSVMTKFGRKIANVASVLITIIGWLLLVLANDVTVILIARFLQGVAMGMITTLGPVLIGECTSPKNRGAFLMMISLCLGIGIFVIHTLGMYLDSKITSYICIILNVLDLIVVLSSPESPIWLADKQKYDQCAQVFRSLRGDTEEDELEKIIAASIIRTNERNMPVVPVPLKDNIKIKLKNIKDIVRQKSFYKPVIIMLHIYTIANWSGVNIVAAYMIDYVYIVTEIKENIRIVIISIDVQRVISGVVGMVLIKKIRRKVMLYLCVGLNILFCLVIAGYTYAKEQGLVSQDFYYIGIVLIHFQVFTIATGALPLSFVLAGEIFPLRFKGVCGGFSTVAFSINIFVCIKTIPILFNNLGLPLTYYLYSGIMVYCLIVVGILLPETKDKTLQDIEDQFEGKPQNHSNFTPF